MEDILRKNIVVITNAGGMNPVACKAALEEVDTRLCVRMTLMCLFLQFHFV